VWVLPFPSQNPVAGNWRQPLVEPSHLQAFLTEAGPRYRQELATGLRQGLRDAVLWYLASFRRRLYQQDCVFDVFLALEALARAHAKEADLDRIMDEDAHDAIRRNIKQIIREASPSLCPAQRGLLYQNLGGLNRTPVGGLVREALESRGIVGYAEDEVRRWCKARNDIAHRATIEEVADDPTHGASRYMNLITSLRGCLERLLLVTLLPGTAGVLIHPSGGPACLQSDPPFRSGAPRWRPQMPVKEEE